MLYEKLSEKYPASSISDLSPAWYYSSIVLLAVLLMALIWWALQVIPKRQARALRKPESPIVIGDQKVNAEGFTYTPQSVVKPTELFSIENEARKTLSQIIGGFVVIVGLILTGANLAITSRLTQEGQITDRFTKAISQLGDEKLEVRLGGIYALERIAKDSEKDHWTIMEVLTAYVREHAPIKKQDNAMKPSPNKRAKDTEQDDDAKLPTDVQAILTVIDRRVISEKREKGTLNLTGTALSKADLFGANLSGADLIDAKLIEADLRLANLFGAKLISAKLSGADLSLAILSGANLSGADLRLAKLGGAELIEAKLGGADLSSAILSRAKLSGADLIGANLFVARLNEANLSGARLIEANLSGADLSAADLSKARDLTWEQVSQAIIDDYTKLPVEIESQHKDELRSMREETKKERGGR
jgi:uncharacterized protein YjbI with pentapeptide repeats